MMADAPRNAAFERAIAAAVRTFAKAHGRPPRVLDIGAGSGLLAMMAARAGACDVHSIEMVPQVYASAPNQTLDLLPPDRRTLRLPPSEPNARRQLTGRVCWFACWVARWAFVLGCLLGGSLGVCPGLLVGSLTGRVCWAALYGSSPRPPRT
jgi:hypothetical protein